MPLIVKDFKWRQTESVVTIQIPLHGIHQSKVDLFTSPKYIKASYERYFFEVFLLYEIKTTESKCTLTTADIVFELVKCENLLWETLELDIPKKEKMELKKQYIEEEHKRFQNECKEKVDKKHELKRVAVREQIAIDTKQRQLIDNIRNEEKTTALGDLKVWHEQTQPKIIELLSDDEDEEPKKEIIKPARKSIPIIPPRRISKRTTIPASVPVPLPRKSQILHIDFTARSFPTPSRESQLAEENEWLRKQAEVRRTVGFFSEDLRPEERNPQYLKSKGDEFLKAKNYLGAISAFSFGIKLSEQFPDLYIGRSLAHYEQGNYYKSAHDCSTALELLLPAVPSNLNERITCIYRRGKALRKLGLLKESVGELEVAVKLRPTDINIITELNETKEELEVAEQKQKLEEEQEKLKQENEKNTKKSTAKKVETKTELKLTEVQDEAKEDSNVAENNGEVVQNETTEVSKIAESNDAIPD